MSKLMDKDIKKKSDENFKKTSKPDTTIPDDRASIVSIVCRICFDDSKDESIITPCRCKGTVAFVHKSCLEKWLSESNTTSCELCHHVYETERVPKYTAKQSIWRWLRYQPTIFGFRVRHIRCDLLACALLTPVAVVVTYICLFSADYYNQQRFANLPTARWTSVSLLVMIAIMLFGYYIWVYVVVGYHGRMWYYWWQRDCIVRYIPPETHTREVETTLITTNITTNPNVEYKSDDEAQSSNDDAVNELNDIEIVILPDSNLNLPEELIEASPCSSHVDVKKNIITSVLIDTTSETSSQKKGDIDNELGNKSR